MLRFATFLFIVRCSVSVHEENTLVSVIEASQFIQDFNVRNHFPFADSRDTENFLKISKNYTFPAQSTMVNCEWIKISARPYVEIIENSDELTRVLRRNRNVLNHISPSPCTLAFIYSRSCPFSRFAARHFTALPRLFPSLRYIALDVRKSFAYDLVKGIVGVPTVALIHNGRLTAKFNGSRYTLEMFAYFLNRITGRRPLSISLDDVESVLKEEEDTFHDWSTDGVDWVLVVSWLVTLVVLGRALHGCQLSQLFVRLTGHDHRE